MRTLKRGARGEDVLLWQLFLVHLRKQPTIGFIPPLARVDGIYGLETAKATQAFQALMQLPSDGLVGNDTYQRARQLGFLESQGTPATPGTQGIAPILGPLMSQIKSEPAYVGDTRRNSTPPAGEAAVNGAEQSHKRLRAETWRDSTEIKEAIRQGGAEFQLLKDGDGDYVYDEYSVLVEAMPKDKTPESFLEDMARDLNGTASNEDFNSVNVFERRDKGKPKIGEIIDIDIKMSPVDGSVVLVELTPTYFVFQTVESEKMGTHPENGCREFGFERVGTGVRFYTRGVSRPGNFIFRWAGAEPQKKGWTSLMRGISAKIIKLGGKSNSTVTVDKKERSH